MKKKFLLIPTLNLFALPFASLASCSKQTQINFDQMRTDYMQMLKDTISCEPEKMMIDKLVDDQDGNLIFSDIDYTDGDKANWPAHKHVLRGLSIAVDAAKKNNKEQLQKAVKLVKHWINHNYVNDNWWFNEIGVPRDISDTALFVWEWLTQDEQVKLTKVIRKGSLLYNKQIEESRKTGTNLFWYGDITMKDSWLHKDQEEFKLMFKLVSDEIKQDQNEGFQSDGSYYQHGQMLYNGGYGRQGAILLAKIMSAFANTEFAWPTAKLEILVNFILKGLATTIHNGYTDYSTMGRTYTRKEANQLDGGTTDLGNVLLLQYVAKLPNCPHKEEVNKVIDAWKNGKPSFTGINYLSKSNFISMNIDGIYMSFKGTRANLINTEKANGENQLGYNLSYGTNTCVMETGKEYFDISPVWVYKNLPGTTSTDDTDLGLWLYRDYLRRELTDGLFGGGTEDGVTFSMQSTSHENVSYTVTCFATPDGMVIVGSNLNYDSGDLHTTVEQCVINEEKKLELSGDKQTVTHGKIVYKNLNPNDELEMETGQVTNSWDHNNDSYSRYDEITQNVLTIKIKHPDANATTYAYCIQPDTKTDKTFVLAANTDKVHAIKLPEDKIAAAFYETTTFEYDGKQYSGNKGEYKVFSL